MRILSSRTAIKAYLSTILFLTTSTVLLTLSSTAYAFFYYKYIPQINLERVLYLQYGGKGHNQYPYATVALDTTALISQQAYDVELILDMPRCRTNLDAGNFMLDLLLLASKPVPDMVSSWLSNITVDNMLHHSRRPAILPYSSPVVSLSHTFLHLPWHLMNLKDLDRSHLIVPMFDMLVFPRGSRNIPSHARLELQSDTTLQVYDAKLVFRAKFQGLRYLVYNYRIVTFVIFTTLFYVVSVTSMALSWAAISYAWSSREGGRRVFKLEGGSLGTTPTLKTEPESPSAGGSAKVKTEDDEPESAHGGLSISNISDTPAQYPTGRGRPPLNYPGRSGLTEAAYNGEGEDDRLRRPMGAGEAADDEDEGDLLEEEEEEVRGRPFDSGIGTSMESEHAGLGIVRRRSSRAQEK